MSVEYNASTVTNMDIDNSKVGYWQLLGNGSKSWYSVYALRTNPFRAATVGLGLLCVLLLAVVIGQSAHYQNVEQDHQSKLQAESIKIEKLQDNLNTVKRDKNNLQTSRDQLQQLNDYLSKRKDQIQTNNNLLSAETTKLKLSQSQLQTSNDALSKEIEQLKASKDQLQTNNNAIITAKNALQKQYDAVVKHKNEAQASYDSVTKERDNLQNKVNNITRAKEQLQLSYNDMIKKVEHLQDRYNFSISEKDKLESHHQNMTISKDALQASYNLLVTATDELRASYASLVKEKDELESSCKSATEERGLLKVKNLNLTAERDALQAEIERLKIMIAVKKCPSGWKTFQRSCYLISASKSAWNESRQYCQSKGADLAIVKSSEEMAFLNGLFSSDKEVWLGLTDAGEEGNWRWVDGTPATTTFWAKDQPNSYDGRNQDCVEFWHQSSGNGSWNDEHCGVEEYFLCKM